MPDYPPEKPVPDKVDLALNLGRARRRIAQLEAAQQEGERVIWRHPSGATSHLRPESDGNYRFDPEAVRVLMENAGFRVVAPDAPADKAGGR